MSHPLDNDIKFLTGVGEMRANLLRSELGIQTIGNLLHYYPYRYLDRSRIFRIGEVRDDSQTYIQLRARITGFQHVGGQAWLNWSGLKESTGSRSGSKWDANMSFSDALTFLTAL